MAGVYSLPRGIRVARMLDSIVHQFMHRACILPLLAPNRQICYHPRSSIQGFFGSGNLRASILLIVLAAAPIAAGQVSLHKLVADGDHEPLAGAALTLKIQAYISS